MLLCPRKCIATHSSVPRPPQDFLTSTSYTLDHPNVALPLRMPAASRIRDALTDAAWVVTNSMPAAPPQSTLALAAAAGGAASANNGDGAAAFEAKLAAALAATIRTIAEEVGPLAEVGTEQSAGRLGPAVPTCCAFAPARRRVVRQRYARTPTPSTCNTQP